MNLRDSYNQVRDISYRIPLGADETDYCCTGKHKLLFEVLEHAGFTVRWVVCRFNWSALPLPEVVTREPHEDASTHAYLEVETPDGSWWKVDATWDKPLAQVLPINEWDLAADAVVAVPEKSTFSPEESARIVADETREAIEADLKVNGQFYAAVNRWLEEMRAG